MSAADRHARQRARALAGQTVAALLEAAGARVEIVVIKTGGDRLQDAPLSEAGGKRLFVKEIEDALLARRRRPRGPQREGHVGVLPDGLDDRRGAAARGSARRARAAARTPRSPISTPALAHLGETPAIGTGSVRRIAQLARVLPRRALLADPRQRRHAAAASSTPASTTRWCSRPPACGGSASATRISAAIPLDVCVPAPGQGIVAIEIRADDDATRAGACSALHDPGGRRGAARPSARWSTALGGGCQLPLGAIAVHDGDELDMQAVVTSLDGAARDSRARRPGPIDGSRWRSGRRARGRTSRRPAPRRSCDAK